MSNMIIEIPEFNETSKKLDRVILLLEKLTSDTGQQSIPPASVPLGSSWKQMMTVKQIAEFLNIAVSTVYRMVFTRRIPFLKIGSRVLFDLNRIKRLLAKNSHNVMSRSQ